MKKILAFLFVLLLCGCRLNTTKDIIKENTLLEDDVKEEIKKSQEEKEEYIDDNPIKLGIFEANTNYSNKHVIEDTYYTEFNNKQDLGSFEVYFTDDKEISGSSQKEIFNKYYNKYSDIDNYKIGYNIKFILTDGTNYNGNFLKPDNFKFADYFYVYLYDDIHQQDNTFYSHLETIEDNTLITTIKIYGVNLDHVENIILTAFTYKDENDFDSEGNYRGNSRHTIRIKKK